MDAIKRLKITAKIRKKFNNPENKTLMQIQNEIAKELGYKNWNTLINKKGELL